MKSIKIIMMGIILFFTVVSVTTVSAASTPGVSKDTRCAVCGMFVAKYPTWLCQIELASGKIEYFDGPKDMFAYYFSPDKYGNNNDGIKQIMVRDYYSLKMINARNAFFVMDSDVYGPMGKEFVPFATQEAAKAFAKDHKAKIILPFKKITDDAVQSMRNGQMMMNMK